MTGISLHGTFAVTGGGSGIGAGVAKAIAACGGDVVVLDLDAGAAQSVASEIGGTGHAVDVSDPVAVGEFFSDIGVLTGLVNCAGIAAVGPIVTCTIEEFRRVVAVHLEGTFLCMQAAAQNMLASGTVGSIVNVSSVNAAFAHRGLGAYSAAKAGISMLTKVAALELAAAGIRVNAVAPGIVATGMTTQVLEDPAMAAMWSGGNPFGRVGQPEDIADVVVFLSSDSARWITGQTIATDGGQNLRTEPKIMPDEAWTRDALVQQIHAARSLAAQAVASN